MTSETQQQSFTVTQVNDYIKSFLDADPNLADMWISAEVSRASTAGSGHSYFTLRDDKSAISCVMFRGGRGAEYLTDGAQLLVHGRISFYQARGDLQFYVDQVRPDGVGALQAAYEKLKEQLAKEGLFDVDRKRPLPRFPQRIGVVTSPTGAVIQDIINVLSRRYPLAEVIVAPTQVQGDTAAPLIVDAIERADAVDDIDVIIVARGGGSLEDLWAFNEESVARAIFATKKPVISAVGHETDTTIADYVADVRAPTPSAAAELVAPDRRELAMVVANYSEVLIDGVKYIVDERKRGVSLAADRLAAMAPDTKRQRQQIDDLLRLAKAAINHTLEVNVERVTGLQNQLRALGPSDILNRGYSIVRSSESGKVIGSTADAKTGDRLSITVTDGEIEADTI
jgi:exodeoxyribonuclease VII large subunit